MPPTPSLPGNLMHPKLASDHTGIHRWKRDEGGVKKERDGKPVLEFVAIRRGDTNT